MLGRQEERILMKYFSKFTNVYKLIKNVYVNIFSDFFICLTFSSKLTHISTQYRLNYNMFNYCIYKFKHFIIQLSMISGEVFFKMFFIAIAG